MNIIINNKVIVEPIINILRQIKIESGNVYFNTIQDKGEYLRVTCPYHKNAQEAHPSCSVYQNTDNDNIVAGTLHCFTCGAKYQLYQVIAHCLNLPYEDMGKEWLLERYGMLVDRSAPLLPELEIAKSKYNYLDKGVLNEFDYSNSEAFDYLINNRHLQEEVIKKFKIGFNTKTRCITFPAWDSKGNLVGIFQRSVDTKNFIIPTSLQKPVYLLDYIKKNNIKTVYVVESQINALTLHGWNRPAVALFGTGTDYQYKELNKSGIRHFILCFDGDKAGDSGIKRFINNINRDIIVDYILMPRGKDVNDLTESEFIELEKKYL